MTKLKDTPHDSDASTLEAADESLAIFAPEHYKRLVCLGPLDPRPNDSVHTERSSSTPPFTEDQQR